MPFKKTNRRITGNYRTYPPVLAYPLDEHVSHVEFKASFTILAHSIASQNERPAAVQANPVANTTATKIWDFTRMSLSLFSGSKSKENPQEFLDMVQKVTDIIGVTTCKSTELASYQLQDVAYTWFKQWKGDRVAYTWFIEWEEFSTSFLDRVFLLN